VTRPTDMEQIDVRILDRDYRLAVPEDEKAKLLDAVRMVDDRMRAVRDAGRVSGIDRIAVMAALQLAHELIDASSAEGPRDADGARRIRKLTEAIDAEIARQNSLF
jgi:cell division protein ZapA